MRMRMRMCLRLYLHRWMDGWMDGVDAYMQMESMRNLLTTCVDIAV